MKRIVVIGCRGAGKSTLAQQIGQILHLPVIHLDAIYWKPGWVSTNKEEWIATIKALLAADEWVIEGNYGATRRLRFEAADTIVFLDFPRVLCLRRAIWRRWQYRNKTRPDMGEGCREKLDWEFLKFIWNFPARSRPKLLDDIEDYKNGREIILLNSPGEVKRFLKTLREHTEE